MTMITGVVTPFPVEKEYEKNPDISPEDITRLREWLDTQPHLPKPFLTDLDLVITYHCCERSMEVSKQVLDLHFTLRTLFTQFFKDRCFDKKAAFCLDTILFAPLETPTPEGHRVVYLRLLDPDPRNFNLVDTVRVLMMIFDLWQYEEGTWPGFVIIIDLDQAVWSHVTKLEVLTVKKVLYFLQECMLTKLKGVHFLNAPYFMDKLMMILKPFLKKQLLSMISIHQIGSETIYDYVPKKAFPKNEGGDYKDHDTIKDEISRRLQANHQFFLMENKRRVDEKMRTGEKSAAHDEFALQGSFKKLDID